MTDRVRMKSRTVFANELITVFPEDGPPEGVVGGTVVVDQEFEAGLNLAKDLDRLGHAEPLNRADLEGDAAPLEPHYSVSVPQMREQDPNWTPTLTPGTTVPSPGPVELGDGERPALDGNVQLGAEQPVVDATNDADATDGEEAASGEETAVLASTRRRNVASRAG